MRRVFCVGLMFSTGLVAACSSDSSTGGGSGGGGGRAGSGGAAAGAAAGGGGGAAAGRAGGGSAGQAAGGVGGLATGGAAGAGGTAGGGGAAGTAGAGGQAAGGAAGAAGAGGQAAGGAAGAVAAACLDPSLFAASFTIVDSTFCAVAMYTAPEPLGFQAPTWGSHGGPLVVQKASTGTGVTLERWTAPAGSTGAMTVQTTPVASALPANTFLGAQALDLPFFGWTAISWANPYPDTTGQIEMVANGAVATMYDVNGPFGLAAVPAASSQGRLLVTALSPLGMPSTNTNGLYAADACSSPTAALGAGEGCSVSALVAAWGDSSGPVVSDSNGDVFAVLNAIATSNQEARGFAAASVARGAGATSGATLFTMAGFSGSLAALSPASSGPGVVVFQGFDSTSFDALDVVQQKFTTTGGDLAASGTPTTLLAMPAGHPQALSFLVDGAQRLWVAASGTSGTTYVVLDRL